jgi:small ligand-binding sensory domain FIST
MSVVTGVGLSQNPDPLDAGLEAAGVARAALGNGHADLAVVFASGGHLVAPEALLAGVNGSLAPSALVGCGAGGVLAAGRELEGGSAVAVWAASFDGGGATPFHLEFDDGLEGMPELTDARAVIMLSDPYSFPTDAALAELSERAPAVPVLGGISSAITDGGGTLFLGEEVFERGAVGVTLDRIEVLPCVSQGAAPFGPELTITAGEENLIHELAGRPALETVERVIGSLPPGERAQAAAGLLIGIVIDGGTPDYEQGDFLVRGVLGADPDTGVVAVGAPVHIGQVVRLHARNAGSADQDLRRALQLRVEALAGRPPAGALVFSCNGRGRAMFGPCDHDAALVDDQLGGAPAAGFFAAGEIGPVGGRSFLHGFTATVAVFAP